jgi:hypothetical protein
VHTLPPSTHTLVDEEAAEGEGTPVVEPTTSAVTATGRAPGDDRDRSSGDVDITARAPLATTPLVKAIHDDIDEDEARRK